MRVPSPREDFYLLLPGLRYPIGLRSPPNNVRLVVLGTRPMIKSQAVGPVFRFVLVLGAVLVHSGF